MKTTVDEFSDQETLGDVYLITVLAESEEDRSQLQTEINGTLGLVGYISEGEMIQFRIDIGLQPSKYFCCSSRQHP